MSEEQRFEVVIRGVDGEAPGEHEVYAEVARDGGREGADRCDRTVMLDPDDGFDGAAIVVRHARGREAVTFVRRDAVWHAWASGASGHAEVTISDDGRRAVVRGASLIDVDWFSSWPPTRAELEHSLRDISAELSEARLLVLYETCRDLSDEQDRQAVELEPASEVA